MALLSLLSSSGWDLNSLSIDGDDVSDFVIFERLRHDKQVSEIDLQQCIGAALGFRLISGPQIVPNVPLLTAWISKLPSPRSVIPLYEGPREFAVAVSNPFDPVLNQIESELGPKVLCKYLIRHSEALEFWSQWENDSNRNGIWQWIQEATQLGASDIHFFKTMDGYQIKFRVHGTMRLQHQVSASEGLQIMNQVKGIAGLDLSAVAGPQDGRLAGNCGGKLIQARVATLPTVHGEDLVVRIFPEHSDLNTLDNLAMSESVKSAIIAVLVRRSGLVLVTGATGSGKTTTLYAMLRYLLKDRNLNIVSLEDPVETVISGVRQSPINHKMGFGFSEGLRAVLRQDPDVILVGEIRDAETARLTIEAAYTGHLVLASLHTTDYSATIQRLSTFGIDKFLIENCLLGVFSQQLIPINCSTCGGVGCEHCVYSGHVGRRPVFSYRVGEQAACSEWESLGIS